MHCNAALWLRRAGREFRFDSSRPQGCSRSMEKKEHMLDAHPIWRRTTYPTIVHSQVCMYLGLESGKRIVPNVFTKTRKSRRHSSPTGYSPLSPPSRAFTTRCGPGDEISLRARWAGWLLRNCTGWTARYRAPGNIIMTSATPPAPVFTNDYCGFGRRGPAHTLLP